MGQPLWNGFATQGRLTSMAKQLPVLPLGVDLFRLCERIVTLVSQHTFLVDRLHPQNMSPRAPSPSQTLPPRAFSLLARMIGPNRTAHAASISSSPLFSLAVAALFLALLTTMLARTPQNGDGAEVVVTALQGGVMHPPGFPLLGWISRLVVELPFGNPVERIAFLNAILHAATLFLLIETLRHVGVRLLPRLTASLAYAFFPSVWYLSTQTEVFSLAYFLMALLTWFVVVNFKEHLPHNKVARAIGLGTITGLCFAQHPIVATGVASFLYALARQRGSGSRISSPIVWAPLRLAAVIASAAYLSLLALRGPNVWPDWGRLRGPADVIRHATRSDYGILTLSAIEGAVSTRGISIVGSHLLRHWNLLLLALPFAPRRGWVWMLWTNLLLACIFLVIAKVPDTGALAWAALERFEGTLLLPAALLLGVGLDRFKHLALQAIAIAIVLGGAMLNYSSANSRSDDTMSVYRNTLASSLPARAVYVADQDLEIFYGVPSPEGAIRFPISAGLFEFPWYRDGVLTKIEPRIGLRGHSTLRDMIATVTHNGLRVYTTEPQIYDNPPMACTRDGLFFVASPAPPLRGPSDSIGDVKMLCSFAVQLGSLPSRGHHYSRLLYYEFADAFTYHAHELAVAAPSGRFWAEAAGLAESAARGLWKTTDGRDWKSACDKLGSLMVPESL